MSLMTIFTAPKAFNDPKVNIIQRNAIRSWTKLGKEVEVILLGDEEGISEICNELNIRHISEISRNEQGTPYINSIFNQARINSDTKLLAYINADIILFPDFLETSRKVSEQCDQFLMVGQRWNLEITEELKFNSGWENRLYSDMNKRGILHSSNGSDYFIYSRNVLHKIPEFTVGRAGWDNWMIYHAVKSPWPAINSTKDIQIIHQNHDYRHLTGGKPHYRTEESFINVNLAGGRRNMFILIDTNKVVVDGKVLPPKSFLQRFLRLFERMFTSNNPDESIYCEAARKRLHQLRTKIGNCEVKK